MVGLRSCWLDPDKYPPTIFDLASWFWCQAYCSSFNIGTIILRADKYNICVNIVTWIVVTRICHSQGKMVSEYPKYDRTPWSNLSPPFNPISNPNLVQKYNLLHFDSPSSPNHHTSLPLLLPPGTQPQWISPIAMHQVNALHGQAILQRKRPKLSRSLNFFKKPIWAAKKCIKW